MEACIFCKIVRKEIPSKFEYEDEECVVFHDIRPRARIHLLVVPKKHIHSLKEIIPEDDTLLGKLLFVTSQVAQENNLEDYKVAINSGKKAGQEVFHLHIHLKSAD